jgi:dipeptide/tripeptide permease
MTEKISIKSLYILLKKAQAVVQKTARKNVTSIVLIFFFFPLFLMEAMGAKIKIYVKKKITLKQKKKKHVHTGRVRSALSRERTLELRQ